MTFHDCELNFDQVGRHSSVPESPADFQLGGWDAGDLLLLSCYVGHG